MWHAHDLHPPWFHTFDSLAADVCEVISSTLRSVYPVPSPAFLWRAACGLHSHSDGRGCEELKRVDASVFHVFLLSSSKM